MRSETFFVKFIEQLKGVSVEDDVEFNFFELGGFRISRKSNYGFDGFVYGSPENGAAMVAQSIAMLPG